jgi:hypothetical protein
VACPIRQSPPASSILRCPSKKCPDALPAWRARLPPLKARRPPYTKSWKAGQPATRPSADCCATNSVTISAATRKIRLRAGSSAAWKFGRSRFCRNILSACGTMQKKPDRFFAIFSSELQTSSAIRKRSRRLRKTSFRVCSTVKAPTTPCAYGSLAVRLAKKPIHWRSCCESTWTT